MCVAGRGGGDKRVRSPAMYLGSRCVVQAEECEPKTSAHCCSCTGSQVGRCTKLTSVVKQLSILFSQSYILKITLS